MPFTIHSLAPFQDIINHVIDDLEGFMQRIRATTIAWNELEKIKGQKSRRKKQAGKSLPKAISRVGKGRYSNKQSS